MKLFTVSEMTFNGHSRSSAMLSFIRSPRLSITDKKIGLHLFSDIITETTLKVDQAP